ncbi:MAG: hypothetical protein Q4C14_08905 [Bacillota bacterium]|nr:hypothetical protein [Bacillota bacterium]
MAKVFDRGISPHGDDENDKGDISGENEFYPLDAEKIVFIYRRTTKNKTRRIYR